MSKLKRCLCCGGDLREGYIVDSKKTITRYRCYDCGVETYAPEIPIIVRPSLYECRQCEESVCPDTCKIGHTRFPWDEVLR